MLNKVINHSNLIINYEDINDKEDNFVNHLEHKNYLLDNSTSSSLISPHGGTLVNRVNTNNFNIEELKSFERIELNENQLLDLEQIAHGVYSPLEGFMDKKELESVLSKSELPNGVIWTVPILLDINIEDSKNIDNGDKVMLLNSEKEFVGWIDVSEKYTYDKLKLSNKFYGHCDKNHPGVKIINSLNSYFIGGKITLIKRRKSQHKNLELTPKQSRRLFDEKNWTKIVGFHTRNVIHKAHEFIQLSALKRGQCDGIFLHPVIGKKKKGDYNSEFIVKSYEIMQKKFYPENTTVFGAFSTYSRYGGVKEAIFTALCRKNYGCSHFIIGRDHTGVGQKTLSKDDIKLTDLFSKLGIEIIKFDTVFYSKKNNTHKEESKSENQDIQDKLFISGTEARNLLKNFKSPPTWFMRPEISKMIINNLQDGKEVFVK
jgi:ATP sulfurylase